MTPCRRARPSRRLSVVATVAALTALSAWPAAAASPVRWSSSTDPVTVGVGQFPAAIAVDPGTSTAYVANSGNGQAVHGTGTLSVINGTDVRTVHLGGTPVGVAVDTTTHTAYVPVFNSVSKLVVLSPGGRSSLPLSNPVAIAVDSTTATAWVLEAPRLLVKVVGGTETTYAIRGALPEYLAVNPVTHTAYVLSIEGVLSRVGPDGHVLVQRLSPSAVALALDTRHGVVYVAHTYYVADGVAHPALLSELTGPTLRVVDLGPYLSVGGLAVDEVTGTAAVTEYSANSAFGQLALVRKGFVHDVRVGGTPRAVSVDSAAGIACVGNRWSGTASIVQGRTAREVPTGSDPVATATDDAAQLCYVANFRSDTVTEIPLAQA